MQVLGRLAATHAVFAREGGLLRPVEAPGGSGSTTTCFTIPKYPGKTNERLTRVLLNITVASADGPDCPRLRFSTRSPVAERR